METTRRNPLRILAPIALLTFALALVLVISNSGGSSGGEADRRDSAAQEKKDLGPPASERRKERSAEQSEKLPQDVYIVQEGDTLTDISEKTGVPVERLQELNPGLDQFSLVKGQRIKLR
jgi:LysM repeat protein